MGAEKWASKKGTVDPCTYGWWTGVNSSNLSKNLQSYQFSSVVLFHDLGSIESITYKNRSLEKRWSSKTIYVKTCRMSAWLLHDIKGGESSSQFQWFTVAKIELYFLISFVLIFGLQLPRYSTNAKRCPPEKSFWKLWVLFFLPKPQ